MRFMRPSAIGLASAVLVLGGCASASPKPGSKDCINTREINTIRALDDEHVLVKLSASRYQLFTVDQPCTRLRLARTISIADAARRVCGNGTTLISFNDPAVGLIRCRIRQSEPVAGEAAARELIEERASRE
jgi:hypothetical protein